MRGRVSLIARVKKMQGDKLTFALEKVETVKRGKPIDPREPEHATSYYLRLTENGKRKMVPAGDNFLAALTALRNGLDACIGCGCLSLKRCAISNPSDVVAADGAGANFLPRLLRRR